MIYIEEEEFTIEGDFMTQEITIYRKPGQYQFEAERYVQENIIAAINGLPFTARRWASMSTMSGPASTASRARG